jgi:hypothetical protein
MCLCISDENRRKTRKIDARARDSLSSVALGIHLPYFVRGNLIKVDIGRMDDRMLPGDICGVDVSIDVPLDGQLPRLFVDSAKITSLLCRGGMG